MASNPNTLILSTTDNSNSNKARSYKSPVENNFEFLSVSYILHELINDLLPVDDNFDDIYKL
jgi:hypothetical protein